MAAVATMPRPSPTKESLQTPVKAARLLDAGKDGESGQKRRKLLEHGNRPVASPMATSRNLKAAASPAGKPAKHLKVVGPEIVQTLRGRILGREVAMLFCGESHEDAVNLTREKSVVEPVRGWLEVPNRGRGWNPKGYLDYPKKDLTLKEAQRWARSVLKYQSEDYVEGATLVFECKKGSDRGTAKVFSCTEKPSSKYRLSPSAAVYSWCDQDAGAREFNARRLKGEDIPDEEDDAFIAERKTARLSEGVELFDDWLLRHCRKYAAGSSAEDVQIDLILEAPVPLSEVELHVEPGMKAAPGAHECIRAVEMDSDMEEAEEGNDGTADYAGYLLRRAQQNLPADRVHGIDPRYLGSDLDHKEMLGICEPTDLPEDREEAELTSLGAKFPVGFEQTLFAESGGQDADSDSDSSSESDSGDGKQKDDHVEQADEDEEGFIDKYGYGIVLPSWEAFFGAIAELLYYSGHIKADWAPLLGKCMGSPEHLIGFFESLYFGTVPDAIAHLGPMDDEARRLTYTRSHAYRPTAGKPLLRRPHNKGLIALNVAPVDRYLKSKGSSPPRLWVSGLVDRLRSAGGGALADTVQAWFRDNVLKILADIKKHDHHGDYFMAWMRECHRDIYNDIDGSTPDLWPKAKSAPSFNFPKNKSKRHNLGALTIPGLEDAFEELKQFEPDAGKATSKRQRVLAKMMVDAFQLRQVDLAAILRMAFIAANAPEDKKLVIVFYGGAEHTESVASFWRKNGFSHTGLPKGGKVGKHSWELKESKVLDFPAYLHDFGKLFPVA